MGIQDRDYMKRRPDDDDDNDRGGRSASSGSGAGVEEFFARFLRRNPKFFTCVGIGLAGLAVVVIVLVVMNERR